MITVLLGDVTRLDFDIAVVGVNERVAPINAISQKIFQNGGQSLQKACSKIQNAKLGSAHITDVENCPYKRVIHVVPPVYMDGEHNEAKILKAVYWNSMGLALEYLLESGKKRISMAFSTLNVEGYHYPSQEMAKIAIETINFIYLKYREARKIDVVFVCDNREDYASIKGVLKRR